MKKTILFLCILSLLLPIVCMTSCSTPAPEPSNKEDPTAPDKESDPDGSLPAQEGEKEEPSGNNNNNNNNAEQNEGKSDSGLPPYNGPAYTEKTPSIYIETENGVCIPANKTDVNCFISLRSNERTQCADGLPATIRTRGNGSLSAASSIGKLPYKIKFRNEVNPFLLGDGKANDWVLLDHVGEHTMLRNYAARLLGDMLDGIPYSTNSRLVNVYLNGSYVGVYELAEQVEVDKYRINVNDGCSTPENGFLVELDSYADELYVTVGGQRYTVKSKVYSDAQLDFIRDYLQQVDDAVYSGDPVRLAELVDMDSVVDMYIVQEYAKNIDVGWSSFFMYRDVGGKLTFAPPWDFDLSFGNDARLDNGSYERLYVGSSRGMMQDHRWYNALYKQPWFRLLVADRWREVSKTIIPNLIKAVRFAAAEIAADMNKNYEKWKILGRKCHQEPVSVYRLTSYKAHTDYLIKWMENRKLWLDRELS